MKVHDYKCRNMARAGRVCEYYEHDMVRMDVRMKAREGKENLKYINHCLKLCTG